MLNYHETEVRHRTHGMPLYVSRSLPSFRLTFAGNEFNEYRFRQGRVEFRTHRGVWRVLEDEEIEFHLVLHTEVAQWLVKHSPKRRSNGAAQGSD